MTSWSHQDHDRSTNSRLDGLYIIQSTEHERSISSITTICSVILNVCPVECGHHPLLPTIDIHGLKVRLLQSQEHN
jgi:hypothetical protein